MFGGVHRNWSGGNEPMDFCDTNIIDFGTDTWTPVDLIRGGNHAPRPRHNHSAVLIGNNVVVFGGVRQDKLYNDLYILSLTADENEAGLEAALAQSTAKINSKPTAYVQILLSLLIQSLNSSMYSKRLEAAYNDENMFPDVCFKFKNKSFLAHKVILSARSSVFKKKFEVPARTRSSFDTDVSRSEIEVSASEKEKKPIKSPKSIRVVSAPGQMA